MADTTTTLNAGVGGDVMDESLVTQTSGTQAKRPRVVPGGDDGSLQTFEVSPEGVSARVVDPRSLQILESLLQEQKMTNALLKMLLLQLSGELPNTGFLAELKED